MRWRTLTASALLASLGACAAVDAALGRGPRAASGPSLETTRQRWERLGFARSVEIDGVAIHYVEAGTGPPVFLLHGMGDCAIGWRNQVEAFAEAGFRAIAWDMMGAGLSAKPLDRDYSIPAMADLFDSFRVRLGAERAVLVGSSYGGSIALLQARLRPASVRALVLLDPAAYADPEVLDHVQLFQKRWFTDLVYPLVPPRWLARIGLSQCLSDFDALDPSVFEAYVAEARRPGA